MRPTTTLEYGHQGESRVTAKIRVPEPLTGRNGDFDKLPEAQCGHGECEELQVLLRELSCFCGLYLQECHQVLMMKNLERSLDL